MCSRNGINSIASEVKKCFEEHKTSIKTWSDLKKNMNLANMITNEVNTITKEVNTSIQVEFNDGSGVYIDNPLGLTGVGLTGDMIVVLPE